MMGYQALLFSPDEKLARVASQVFTELDFTVEPAHEPFGAVKKLMTQHYDAIVVDCDNEQNASLLFRSARNSSTNHSSLAIALVEGQAGVAKAYRIGANLVLTKPINVEQAKGTLRVARGLLRKNSEAAGGSATSGTGHTIPASAAPVSAGSSPPWVRQGEAASTQPSSHPGLPEFEAPAFINDALPAGFERGLPGAFSAEFPTECPAEFPTTTASASVEDKPATQPAYPSVIKAYRPVIKNDAGKAGIVTNETARIAFTSLSTQNISSGFTSAGSAAAPAPAKEVTAPPARENHNNKENKQKENNQKEKNQVDDKHANRSHDAAPMLSVVPLLNGPSFSVLGEEDSGESGGKKKILIAAVIAVAVVALGYFGYGSRGKSSTASPASQPVSTFQSSGEQDSGKQDSGQTTPVPVPRSSPNVEPSLSTSTRASASAQPPAPKTSAARLPGTLSPGAGSPPVTRIALDPDLGAKKPESTPLLVKSNPAQTKVEPQSQESTPPPPSPLAVASAAGASNDSASNDSALRGLMSSAAPSLPQPTLVTAKVSQGVSQGLLIKRVQPNYPQAALAMHTQGAVQIEATINKEGNVINLKVLKGDPLLAHAALEAVRQWRYKPYYLDGEPVEIQTQITVNFKTN